MIVVQFFESRRRLLQWRWMFRFRGLNNETLGDDYNDRADAVYAVGLITNPSVPVEAQVLDRRGNIVERWPLR